MKWGFNIVYLAEEEGLAMDGEKHGYHLVRKEKTDVYIHAHIFSFLGDIYICSMLSSGKTMRKWFFFKPVIN